MRPNGHNTISQLTHTHNEFSLHQLARLKVHGRARNGCAHNRDHREQIYMYTYITQTQRVDKAIIYVKSSRRSRTIYACPTNVFHEVIEVIELLPDVAGNCEVRRRPRLWKSFYQFDQPLGPRYRYHFTFPGRDIIVPRHARFV